MGAGLAGFVVNRGLGEGQGAGAMQELALPTNKRTALGRSEKAGLHLDGDGAMIALHTASSSGHGRVHEGHDHTAMNFAKNVQVLGQRAVLHRRRTLLKAKQFKADVFIMVLLLKKIKFI